MQIKTWQLATLAAVALFSLKATAAINEANYNITSSSTAVSIPQEVQTLTTKAPNIDPDVLKLALTAYMNARKLGLDSQGILTVIDYHDPDNQKRLWVFNLKRNSLVYNTWVAHGQGSGNLIADYFSNQPQTHASSIGLYETENPYYGSHGYSLRLNGLDQGYNNNALSRDIVMNAAWYVEPEFAEDYGHIGRSWGCLAVDPQMANPLINTIKGGTLIFAYAPNYSWLHHSVFLDNA